MKPHYIELRNPETGHSITLDIEGPYHSKNKRIGEHIYGNTLLIDNVPYHFEKYVPTSKEIRRFQEDNTGIPRYSKGGYFYRLVPFTK
jgi:hypothetical protein